MGPGVDGLPRDHRLLGRSDVDVTSGEAVAHFGTSLRDPQEGESRHTDEYTFRLAADMVFVWN
jgi:hypothetical protein